MAVLSKVANIAVQPQPVGVVEAFAGTNAPNGWLICDGSQVSRSLFPELFSVIGTQYGSGDGFSTFTLPDLRGRTIAGRDGVNNMNNGPTNRLTSTHFGASGTALGNSGGVESHTLTTAQLPAHAHDVRSNIFGTENSVPVGDGRAQPSTTAGWTWSVAGNAAANHLYTKNTGSGAAHNITQPTMILNYIIKAVSELPRGGWYNSSSPDLVTSLPTNPFVGQEVFHLVSGNVFYKRYDGSLWKDVGPETVSTSRLSGTVANTNLPDGAPTWVAVARAAFPAGNSQAANVSIGVPYKSEVMIMASASAFGGVGLARTYIAVYGVTGWTEGSYYYFNVGGDHRTTPTAAVTVTLNAGTYTFGCLQNFTTDSNDQATFMVFGKKVT